ncbi:MAG: GTP 3',8-cyclase MoaA [Sandaracinaceae bacterium]|nr:GTP 3',8-cyclase MoaA [Sandaracinaceae bacterium]
MKRLPVVSSRMATYDALAVVPPTPAGFGANGLPALTDSRGRRYTYARISLTDRCDMACVYCMPPGGEDEHAVREELMTFEEVARLVQVLAAMGVTRVRFTGGEPLVRKDIVRLVALTHRLAPKVELVMTTNAGRLAELAAPLREAGLRGVNVSIDSLDEARFAEITRGGSLPAVLAGLHAAREAGLRLKTNTVAMRGMNDRELEALVRFAWSLGATPRFIELMPLGEGAKLPLGMRMTRADVEQALGDLLVHAGSDTAPAAADQGPARYAHARGDEQKQVGFITPLSSTFCDSCNRIRLTARGDLRSCLASRSALSLRDILRAGGTDADVAWALETALGKKGEGHGFLNASESEHTHVGMSLIGG